MGPFDTAPSDGGEAMACLTLAARCRFAGATLMPPLIDLLICIAFDCGVSRTRVISRWAQDLVDAF